MLNTKIYSLTDLSQLLQKSKVTVWRYWAKDKILPAPIQLNGRCLGWKQTVINDWLDSNTQGTK